MACQTIPVALQINSSKMIMGKSIWLRCSAEHWRFSEEEKKIHDHLGWASGKRQKEICLLAFLPVENSFAEWDLWIFPIEVFFFCPGLDKRFFVLFLGGAWSSKIIAKEVTTTEANPNIRVNLGCHSNIDVDLMYQPQIFSSSCGRMKKKVWLV